MTDPQAALSEQGRGQAEGAGAEPGQRGNKWWTLVAVCLGTFMLLLDITIVNVALPDIQRALHSSFSDLQWIVDAYALTLAAFLLTAGSLADMYGRRLLYLIGLVVFTCASALCGFAVSTLMLQLSRALQGVGGAIMFAVSLALLADAFRGKDRGVAFGVWGAVTGLAVAIGPLLGGRADLRPVLAVDLLRQRADRHRGRHHQRAEGGRIARAAGQPPRLGRLRALHAGAVEPGLRADRVEPAFLHRRPGARLLRRGGRAARRLRPRGAAQRAPDVRPEPVPAADLQRRLGRGVRAQRLDLLDAALPRAVHAGHPGLLAAGHRRAADGASPAASWSPPPWPGG